MTLQLDFVGITVADMARSLAFYRRLGIEIPEEADAQPHVDVTLPSGLRLAWDTHDTMKSFDPGWEAPSGGTPPIELAFKCESPADVDRMFKELVVAGTEGHLEPFDAFWGQRYATLRDPDGNGISLFAPQ